MVLRMASSVNALDNPVWAPVHGDLRLPAKLLTLELASVEIDWHRLG